LVDHSGQKVGGGEDLEIGFRVPRAPGAVVDGLGVGVPGDFLKGEPGAEEVLGEATVREIKDGAKGASISTMSWIQVRQALRMSSGQWRGPPVPWIWRSRKHAARIHGRRWR
jgi:hypothetical protein